MPVRKVFCETVEGEIGSRGNKAVIVILNKREALQGGIKCCSPNPFTEPIHLMAVLNSYILDFQRSEVFIGSYFGSPCQLLRFC